MTFVVTEPCFGCKYTDCVTVCPVEAFREGREMVFIDPEVCICCGLCEPECPVDAIFVDDEVPDEWSSYIALNAEMAPQCPEIVVKRDPLPGCGG